MNREAEALLNVVGGKLLVAPGEQRCVTRGERGIEEVTEGAANPAENFPRAILGLVCGIGEVAEKVTRAVKS